MGRPADADDLLQALVGPSSDSLDREAAWLLSRAALQLDQQEKADSMLLLAGDFGRNATPIEEPSPFVGSRRCRDCHLRTYREQQESSRHAHTLRFGPDLKSVPLPTRPVADPVFPRMTHHFSRKNDEQIDLETRTDDRTIHAIVEYALGSGRHGISMVARDDAGIDRELRISYFADAQTWVKTKGIDMAPQDAGDHIGLALSPASLDHCLNCHKTSFRPIDPSRRGRQWPETQDHGIGCERCHGPGLNHVKAAETGFAELAIAQTSTTPALSRLRSCTECHASDGSVNASDPEFTRAREPLCCSVNASPVARTRLAARPATIRTGCSRNRSRSMRLFVWPAIPRTQLASPPSLREWSCRRLGIRPQHPVLSAPRRIVSPATCRRSGMFRASAIYRPPHPRASAPRRGSSVRWGAMTSAGRLY